MAATVAHVPYALLEFCHSHQEVESNSFPLESERAYGRSNTVTSDLSHKRRCSFHFVGRDTCLSSPELPCKKSDYSEATIL